MQSEDTATGFDGDIAMLEAAAPTTIQHKVKSSLRNTIYGDFVDKTELTALPDLSGELRALKEARATRVDCDELTGAGEVLLACDCSFRKTFLGLDSTIGKFYIRDGYKELYNNIQSLWQNPRTTRVTLLGNAGTGKSWFQIFVLRELLEDTSGFKFVIRQVGTDIYLVDLEECEIYGWFFNNRSIRSICDQMEETLYFYEPGSEKEQPPLALELPSLATLSPYMKRISEYQKQWHVLLYFWPWSFSTMAAVAKVSELGISSDELSERYYYFGGIIRHVLAHRTNETLKELKARVVGTTLEVLQSIAVNIDRDLSGGNVSGYICCYDNKNQVADGFQNSVLEYTSAYVEEEVEKKLRAVSLKEKVKTVSKRLNNELVDVSGKSLEAVATEFLSKGKRYKWEARKIGENEGWFAFQTTTRQITREWDITGKLQQSGVILVPTKANFPFCDIIFSCPGSTDAIHVVQFTWQRSHPSSVRSLYDLRVKRLGAGHDRAVNVYIISPNKEESYAIKEKEQFLKGQGQEQVEKPLKWSMRRDAELVPAEDLKTMWGNTHIHVLRPKDVDWTVWLNNWLSDPQNN